MGTKSASNGGATAASRRGALLSRLARNTSGNTLAIMAIALIPLSALVGSGVDTARIYVVQSRLQQACDAGVLAGRKFMTPSASPTLETAAADQARAFFNNNFEPGWMGTSNVVFTPTKTADQQVAGVAVATVPMTIMKMFRATDANLSVSCEARFDVADSDIMFVLDVTGSMACAPADSSSTCSTYVGNNTVAAGANSYAREKTGSRMQALRQAVVDFEETMRTNSDPTTRVRYGFVPYSSAVNAGAAIVGLPGGAQHMVRTTHTYNSRRVIGDANNGDSFATTRSGYTSRSSCENNANGRVPATGYNSDGTAIRYSNASWSSGTCNVTRQNLRANWRFEPIALDVSTYFNTLTSGSIVDPTRLDGRTTRWRGCIEERQTTTDSSFNIDSLPADLNPDLIPNSNGTRWKPAWPDATWGRNHTSSTDSSQTDAWFEDRSAWSPYNGSLRQPGGFAACPPAARRLATMTAAQISSYVNAADFLPHGGTYHDIGMIWGVRMISPNGVFAADTAASAGRPAPRRHVVFMTDGELAPNVDIYGAYGIQRYDNRVGGGTTLATVTARHNARFLAVCEYARERLNMTVWVVTLSTGLTDDLRSCATSNDHAFTANSRDELRAAFRRIAQQVAMLRLDR